MKLDVLHDDITKHVQKVRMLVWKALENTDAHWSKALNWLEEEGERLGRAQLKNDDCRLAWVIINSAKSGSSAPKELEKSGLSGLVDEVGKMRSTLMKKTPESS
tara:strand:+ start:111436 stop:111747 length:312 start_codon:yes stop_codon:yes gene_type:complete